MVQTVRRFLWNSVQSVPAAVFISGMADSGLLQVKQRLAQFLGAHLFDVEVSCLVSKLPMGVE